MPFPGPTTYGDVIVVAVLVVVVSIVYEQVQVPFVTFTEVFMLLALHAVEGGCTPAPNAEQLHL